MGGYELHKQSAPQVWSNNKIPPKQGNHNHTNSMSFFKDEENLETSIITSEGINMNNKERIDNKFFNKDNKIYSNSPIQQIRTDTGVMKGNIFTMQDPEKFKKLEKNKSESILDIPGVIKKMKTVCTCEKMTLQEEEPSMTMSPSMSFINGENLMSSIRHSHLVTAGNPGRKSLLKDHSESDIHKPL